MKAVILAGGEGARLRPLTETVPKPMLPVSGDAMLFRALRKLRECGVREAVITTGYLAQEVEKLGSECEGIFLHYFREEHPLGTAGGLKYLGDFLSEPFFVLCGDAVFDFSLRDAAEFHREKNALVTVLLSSCEEVGEMGVCEVDKNGVIRRFLEKPALSQITSDSVNTGIYLCSPELLSLLPEKTPLDFGRDVFPSLLLRGKKIYGFQTEGFWSDIGTPERFLEANLREGDCVGKGCKVAGSAKISGSVLLDGCEIGENAVISGSIVGNDCKIGVGAMLEGCVLGKGCLIGENAIVGRGRRLKSGTVVPRGEILMGKEEMRFETESGFGLSYRTEDGSGRMLRKIGSAFSASLAGENPVGVLLSGEGCEKEGGALLDGIRAAGYDAVMLGYGYLAACRSITVEEGLSGCLFVSHQNENTQICMFDKDGLYPVRPCERKFYSLLREEMTDTKKGRLLPARDALLKRGERVGIKEGELSGLAVLLTAGNTNTASEFAARLLKKAGNDEKGDRTLPQVTVEVSEDGTELKLSSEGFEEDLNHIAALLLLFRPEWFEPPLAIPASSPLIFDRLTLSLRYSVCPVSGEESLRRAARKSFPLFDAPMALLLFLRLYREEGMPLEVLGSLLPPFYEYEIRAPYPVSGRYGILSRLGAASGDGVLRRERTSSVRIIPMEYGYKIRAEAANAETAMELCGKMRDALKNGKEKQE